MCQAQTPRLMQTFNRQRGYTVTDATPTPQLQRARKAVNIVAMGSSREDFMAGMLIEERPDVFRDAETWVINYMAAIMPCDRVIHVDPVHAFLHYPVVKQMCDNALKMGIPFYTSAPHPAYANHIMYPFHKVHETFRSTYFNTTVAYAFALALMEGYTHIGLFGCDFSYPNLHVAESGRACVEFWMGQASLRGVNIAVAGHSTLMDMRECVEWNGNKVQQPYGFWEDPNVPPAQGGKLMHPEKMVQYASEWKPRGVQLQEVPPNAASNIPVLRSVG